MRAIRCSSRGGGHARVDDRAVRRARLRGAPARNARCGRTPRRLRCARPAGASRRRPGSRDSGRAPAVPPRAAAPRAPCAPRPASCGMRAAGVPGRAEYGKTCRKVRPHSSTSASEFANIASVSVGKPAIRSAPNTMSGRKRRAPRGRSAIASSRRCRRFMRFRIRSSPACRVRCRCGISRGSSRDQAHQVRVDLDRVDRGEPQPRQLRHQRQQPAAPAGPGSARPAGRRHSR